MLAEDFFDDLTHLLELEHSALETFEAAELKLEAVRMKEGLRAWHSSHRDHVAELKAYCQNIGQIQTLATPLQPLITQFQVKLATLLGDTAVLSALETLSSNIYQAYVKTADWPQNSGPIATLLEAGRTALAQLLGMVKEWQAQH